MASLYTDIIREISSKLTGNAQEDIAMLQAEAEQYRTHEYSQEILRAIGRMMYQILPEDMKQEFSQAFSSTKLSKDTVLDEVKTKVHEGNLKEAVDQLKLKVGIPEKQPLDTDGTIDSYARRGQESTWKEIVGFRNLFAEYETCGNEGNDVFWLRPYVDDFKDYLYWAGEEKETVCQYWKTGDKRHLWRWWDRWEDSDYNRLYYPLEFYGKEPVYS